MWRKPWAPVSGESDCNWDTNSNGNSDKEQYTRQDNKPFPGPPVRVAFRGSADVGFEGYYFRHLFLRVDVHDLFTLSFDGDSMQTIFICGLNTGISVKCLSVDLAGKDFFLGLGVRFTYSLDA